jgi:serine/threonine protein kinase
MIEHFTFRGHLCIAMELLSINLYELIKANGFVGFSTTLIRRFTNQMLLSLSLMRHHRIVHCDLKPENVLLKHPAKSAIKVIDFGSSCFEHEKSEPSLSRAVISLTRAFSLYLYPKSLLSLTGGHHGHELPHGD